jgi:hypothetical protein
MEFKLIDWGNEVNSLNPYESAGLKSFLFWRYFNFSSPPGYKLWKHNLVSHIIWSTHLLSNYSTPVTGFHYFVILYDDSFWLSIMITFN